MYISNPFLLSKLENLSKIWLNILFYSLAIIYLIDIVLSTNVINYVRKTTKEIGKELDNTEEITKKVREILKGKSGLYRRLLNAYPKIQSIKVKIKEKQKQIKKQVEEQQEKIKRKINNLKEEKNKKEDINEKD